MNTTAAQGAALPATKATTDRSPDMLDTSSAPRRTLSILSLLAEQAWRSIETAPRDGTRFIAYRPLAALTHDPEIFIVHGSSYDRGCWPVTVPEGMDASNFTSGYCKATHWTSLPAAPSDRVGAA